MTPKKTVLITGATNGIGRATALALAREGYRVFATGRRQGALDALAREAEGTSLEVLRLDVTDPESIEAARLAVDAATDGAGVDVLVNNAGYGQGGALLDLSDGALRAQFETNVFGLMSVTRAFVGPMIARGSGRVLNVSSVGGHFTAPFFGAYHASKYADRSLSDALRNELRPLGVQVVLIEPGPIDTGFSDAAVAALDGVPSASSRFRPIYDQVAMIEQHATMASADVSVVVRGIVRAIEARRPAVRYVVPFSSRLLVTLAGWIPDAGLDLVWSTLLRLGGMRRDLGSPAVA